MGGPPSTLSSAFDGVAQYAKHRSNGYTGNQGHPGVGQPDDEPQNLSRNRACFASGAAPALRSPARHARSLACIEPLEGMRWPAGSFRSPARAAAAAACPSRSRPPLHLAGELRAGVREEVSSQGRVARVLASNSVKVAAGPQAGPACDRRTLINGSIPPAARPTMMLASARGSADSPNSHTPAAATIN